MPMFVPSEVTTSGKSSLLTSIAEGHHHESGDQRSLTEEEEEVPSKEEQEDEVVVDVEPGSSSEADEPHAPPKGLFKETWIDKDDFAHCFQSLLVFHKPEDYQHVNQAMRLKTSIWSKASFFTASSSSSLSNEPDPGLFSVAGPECSEARGVHFLCVDLLEPSEILISFSAVLLWGEGAEERSSWSSSGAVLLVRPHSWKSHQTHGPHVLSVKTTSSKAAALQMPPGRHVLVFHARATLGYHVLVCSRTAFVFGTEDTVMTQCCKESVGFREQAASIMVPLSDLLASFKEGQDQKPLRRSLEQSYIPEDIKTVHDKYELKKVFKRSVHHMLREALGRTLTPEENLAVMALTLDPALLSSVSMSSSSEAPETWRERRATEDEVQAVVRLQAGLRRHLVRETLQASRHGTEKNLSVAAVLDHMWSAVKQDVDKNAGVLLLNIFRLFATRSLYPCQRDESTRIYFDDYVVPLQGLTSRWTLIFREVFMVQQTMLLVPKVDCPSQKCLLHVVDNDTGEQLDMCLHRVAPHTFHPNQRGYTFVAHVSAPEPGPGLLWRMRLIGTREPLARPLNPGPFSTFSTQEIQDYYVPNDRNIICCYRVSVDADVVASVQFQTSKEDVLVRLTVLDGDNQVTSASARGHAVIPVVHFLVNRTDESQISEDDCVRLKDEETTTCVQFQPRWETMQHKYLLKVELLHQSWEMNESQLEKLHGEKNPSRVTLESTSEEHRTSSSRTSDRKKSRPSAKTRASNKQEATLDVSRPHWSLRVVVDKDKVVLLEKDVERIQQIKALKNSWEAADEGRAAKAQRSRLDFLRGPRSPQDAEERSHDTEAAEDPASGGSAQDDLARSRSFQQMDFSPFIRGGGSPALLLSEVKEVRRKQRLEKIQTYRLVRDIQLENRGRRLQTRRDLMEQQMQTYQQMQEDVQDRRKNFLEERLRVDLLGSTEMQDHSPPEGAL